jgi:hypothetical protein
VQGQDIASITTFAVQARDINATALPNDDKDMGLKLRASYTSLNSSDGSKGRNCV